MSIPHREVLVVGQFEVLFASAASASRRSAGLTNAVDQSKPHFWARERIYRAFDEFN
jgi:hypothetical protein